MLRNAPRLKLSLAVSGYVNTDISKAGRFEGFRTMPVTLIFGDTFTASFVTEMIGHFTVKHLSQQPTEHMGHKIFRILCGINLKPGFLGVF